MMRAVMKVINGNQRLNRFLLLLRVLVLILVITGGDSRVSGFLGGAFAYPPCSAARCVSTTVPLVTREEHAQLVYCCTALSAKHHCDESENEQQDPTNSIDNGPGVGRRGTLMTFLGAAANFAMGDVALNAATSAIGGSSAATATITRGLYERVLAFGNRYRGTAVASEELTTWIASQSVATTPEITAWLAAQRRLQMVRKATAVATTAVTPTKTAKQASTTAAVVGGGLEEGLLAAAAAAAATVSSKLSRKKDDGAGIVESSKTSTESLVGNGKRGDPESLIMEFESSNNRTTTGTSTCVKETNLHDDDDDSLSP